MEADPRLRLVALPCLERLILESFLRYASIAVQRSFTTSKKGKSLFPCATSLGRIVANLIKEII